MRKVAKQNVEEYQERYKKQYDKNSEPSDYAPGTRVLLYNPKVPPGKSSKLWRKFQGPYYVTMKVGPCNYILRDCKTHLAIAHPVHADRLKRYTVRNMFVNREQSTAHDGEQFSDETEHEDQETPTVESGGANLGQDFAEPKKSRKRRDKSPGPGEQQKDTTEESATEDASAVQPQTKRNTQSKLRKTRAKSEESTIPDAPPGRGRRPPRSKSADADSQTDKNSEVLDTGQHDPGSVQSGSAEADVPHPAGRNYFRPEQSGQENVTAEGDGPPTATCTAYTQHNDGKDESSAESSDNELEDPTAKKGEWHSAKELTGLKKINGKRHYRVVWEDETEAPTWIDEDDVSDLLKEHYHIRHTQLGAVRKSMKHKRKRQFI